MALLVAFVAVGLLALYYVAMNAFIGTSAFRSAISYDPQSLRVEYGRAYSVIPGKIHVEGLRIRGRDSHVEWILALDRCDFRVSFVDLLRRRFHASDVEGDGLTLRVRRRRDQVTAEAMSATPPIPGFLDPPLTDVGPPLPPLTDADYRLWSIFLDRVHAAHVREIWVDTVRYSGDLFVSGSWFFRPLRWLEVAPATVELHSLDVSFGQVEPWAQAIAGRLDVAVAPTDLVTARGGALLGHLSVRGDAGGEASIANPLDRLLSGVRLAPVRVRFDASVDIDHGVVGQGTHLSLDPFPATVRVGDDSLSATVSAVAEVSGAGRATGYVTAASLRFERASTLIASAKHATVRAETRAVDLARVAAGQAQDIDAVGFDAPDVDWPSLSALTALVHPPDGLAIDGGRARADVSVDLDPAHETGRARADVRANGIRARFVGQPIAGEARLVLRAAARGGTVDVSGSSLTFRADGDPETAWWGGVELTEATMRGVKAPYLRARVAMNAKDASPLAALVASKTPIPRWAVAAVPTTDLQATADIVVSPRLVEARSMRAHCAGVDGRFEYLLRGHDAGWALWLDLGLVRAAAYEEGGATQLALSDTEPWFVQHVARLRTLEREAE